MTPAIPPLAQVLGRLRCSLRGQRGVALVSVLWVMTLLALIAAAFLHTTRSEINLTYNLSENAKAEALAEAGVQQAVFGLMDPDPDRAWRVDGTPYAWLYGGGEIRAAVQDEGGKIDLNQGDETLFVALFQALGVAPDEAQALSDAIADYRDADDLRRPQGAEDFDYRRAGLDWDAKDAPFEAVEELQQVYGMTAPLYRAVAPAVTVYARKRRPYEATAPALVAAALAGEVREAAPGDELRPQQEGDQGSAVPEAGAAGAPPDAALPPGEADLGATPQALTGVSEALRSRVRVFTVHAEGRTASGAVFAREAVVQLTGGATPYRVLDWRQGVRTLFPPPQSTEADAAAE